MCACHMVDERNGRFTFERYFRYLKNWSDFQNYVWIIITCTGAHIENIIQRRYSNVECHSIIDVQFNMSVWGMLVSNRTLHHVPGAHTAFLTVNMNLCVNYIHYACVEERMFATYRLRRCTISFIKYWVWSRPADMHIIQQ